MTSSIKRNYTSSAPATGHNIDRGSNLINNLSERFSLMKSSWHQAFKTSNVSQGHFKVIAITMGVVLGLSYFAAIVASIYFSLPVITVLLLALFVLWQLKANMSALKM
ncbi:MAG: hypothetical protein JHC93_03810 [Parachlamydiales bacterium]|nr:hypothetical protein [Parachlamydiales bacterium]